MARTQAQRSSPTRARWPCSRPGSAVDISPVWSAFTSVCVDRDPGGSQEGCPEWPVGAAAVKALGAVRPTAPALTRQHPPPRSASHPPTPIAPTHLDRQHHVARVADVLQVAPGVVQRVHPHRLLPLPARQVARHRQQRAAVVLALWGRRQQRGGGNGARGERRRGGGCTPPEGR